VDRENGKQHPIAVSNSRRGDQNFSAGERRVRPSRMSNSFWAQYTRSRLAQLTSFGESGVGFLLHWAKFDSLVNSAPLDRPNNRKQRPEAQPPHKSGFAGSIICLLVPVKCGPARTPQGHIQALLRLCLDIAQAFHTFLNGNVVLFCKLGWLKSESELPFPHPDQ
ncbi:MAG: hypothetical protein ACLP7I_07525, partial [Limisphaerales bacterium]